jgi:hypothetical protein
MIDFLSGLAFVCCRYFSRACPAAMKTAQTSIIS